MFILAKTKIPFFFFLFLITGLSSYSQWNTDTIAGGNKVIRKISKVGKQFSVRDQNGGNFLIYEKQETNLSGNFTARFSICLQQIKNNGQTQFGTIDSGKVLVPVGSLDLYDVVSDNIGGFYMTYETYRFINGTQQIRSLFIQHVNGSGVTLWPGNGIEIQTSTGFFSYCAPTLVAMPGQQVAITWSEEASMANLSYVWAQKLSESGQKLWGSTGTLVAHSPVGYLQDFTVTHDNAGGLLITYEDNRNAPPIPTPGQEYIDLFFQHVLSNGTLALDPNGVPLVVADFDQILPDRKQKQRYSFPDGSGGQYFVYYSALNELFDSLDVYLQRISPTGQKIFPGYGVKITQAGQNSSFFNELFLIPSENNSVSCYFELTNLNSGNFSKKLLCVQKVNSSGQKFWNAANGLEIDQAWSDDGEYTDPFDVAWDSSGNHMITYFRYIGDTSSQVVIQYLNAAGEKQFAASGKTLLAATAVKLDINRNSDGYFMVHWQDLRNYPANAQDWNPPTDLFTQRINAQGRSGERRIIYSQTSGNWNNPATWQGGVVPTLDDEVVVRHQITVTASTGCYSLRVETANG
ncbi:MAG: hypothetical protein RLY16_2885, partial [Bacteroidota bacterium]